MDALWKMLENAIMGGNWIVVVIVGIVIVAYIYFTNKNNVTADVVDAVAALKVALDANTAADAEAREALEANAAADAERNKRLENVEKLIEEMYTPITGKTITED